MVVHEPADMWIPAIRNQVFAIPEGEIDLNRVFVLSEYNDHDLYQMKEQEQQNQAKRHNEGKRYFIPVSYRKFPGHAGYKQTFQDQMKNDPEWTPQEFPVTRKKGNDQNYLRYNCKHEKVSFQQGAYNDQGHLW